MNILSRAKAEPATDHTHRCAACEEQPPEPLEPYNADGQGTWRCVNFRACVNRARRRRLGMWAP